MAGSYEKELSIQEVIDKIVHRKCLLPAIQRKFTWSSSQIRVLFDSIMRGYPINTFMFWEVSDQKVKNNFRFYQFLEKYCERFHEDNPDFDTKGHDDFYAVIDGQQRLTSLYIGLKGTYAYKLPRKWWPSSQDDNILPPRKLYLNLETSLDVESNEEMMEYDFMFLTDSDYKQRCETKDGYWFLVGEILNFPNIETKDDVLDIVRNYLEEHNIQDNKYARKTLTRLYFAFRDDKAIHFYNEKNQEIEHVLDIFIRTNHGGTPLSFSDILMSIAVANWKQDARQQIDDLVSQVRTAADMGYSINRDFVLKTSLMLTENDVRFKVTNFNADQVSKIEEKWNEIKACILEVFRLIHSLGLNDASLRAKNAAIPIAYYLYNKNNDKTNNKKQLYDDINKRSRHNEERNLIRQWLHMALLKGVFGGQGDSLLTNLRKIIRENLHYSSHFPLEAIIKNYKGSTKDLSFDDDFIERLLKTQKSDSSCFSILALLFPDLDFTQSLDKDHLHPASSFEKKSLDKIDQFNNPGGRAFYEDQENWNSIINLHLLNSSKNKSKNSKSLRSWLSMQDNIQIENLLIPKGTDLAFDEFESFCNKRREYLVKKLKSLVK